MPLQTVVGPHYIRRVRIYVDPDLRDPNRSVDQFEFLLPLDNLYEKVASIELVSYNVRRSIQRTFMAQVGTGPAGNNIVDIHMEDVATGLEVLDFALVIEEADYVNGADLAAALTTQLNTQMDAQSHAFHNTGNTVVWTVTFDPDPNILGMDDALVFLVEEGAVADTVQANFLFSSGRNSSSNAAKVLGFTEDDTLVFASGGNTFYNPVPTHTPVLTPFRYLDVFIKEFSELLPVGRVWLTPPETHFFPEVSLAHDTILLNSAPKHRIEELRFDLRLPNGRKPAAEICAGIDLVFDLLLISHEHHIPNWVQQRLEY